MSNAATISRVLRKGGLNPLGSGTPRTREGIRVSTALLGRVRIVFDLNSNSEARQLRASAETILHERGYATRTWDGQHGDVVALYVVSESGYLA